MTWANLIATGNGRLSYRLVIEGWPEVFVTGSWITTADDRVHVAALSYKGLRISDRTYPGEGRCDTSGMTFRLTPPRGTATSTGSTDPVTASLSVYPEPVARLDADLDTDATTWTTSQDLTVGYYHLGTEAVYWGGEGEFGDTLDRQQWQTLPQKHWAQLMGQGFATYIYDRPPTMEGRRAYLYGYATGDAPAGGGTLIWRGIVSRPPRIAEDGVSWDIECLGIGHNLKQSVASYDTSEIVLTRLYHHSYATFSFFMILDGVSSSMHKVCGIFDVPSLITAVNTELALAIVECGADAFYLSVTLDLGADGTWVWKAVTRDEPGNNPFVIFGGSHICGMTDYGSKWSTPSVEVFYQAGGAGATIILEDEPTRTPILGNAEYTMALEYTSRYIPEFNQQEYAYSSSGNVANPLGYASQTAVGSAHAQSPNEFFASDDPDDLTDYPPWRLLVTATDLAALADTIGGVFIDNGGKPSFEKAPYFVSRQFTVTGAGTVEGVGYLDIEPRQSTPNPLTTGHGSLAAWAINCTNAGYAGMLTAEHVLKISRAPITGSLKAFRDAVVAQSVFANLGDAPFITSADLGDFPEPVMGGADIAQREYTFYRPTSFDRILSEEAKLAGLLVRVESDGRIGVKPLQLPTDTYPVDDAHDIDATVIITPAGSFGAWPQVEPQADGIITSLTIQQVYEPIEDKWTDNLFKLVDVNAVSTHKNRGKANVEIKPYSRPVADTPVADFESAQLFLKFNSYDYIIVTVRVPYKKFPVLVGDYCMLTSKLIPAGDGTRGVTRKGALCVGRTWDLDPASEAHGELILWVLANPVYGYAPSARITTPVNTSGTTWTLSMSSDQNQQFATTNDGLIAKHFTVGDKILVRQYDDATPVEVTGLVSAIAANYSSITVVLDGAWTPGGDEWMLEFIQDDTTATTAMRRYCYVADDGLRLATGAFARRLS